MNADEIVKELIEIAEKLDRLDDSISGDVKVVDVKEVSTTEQMRLS